MGKTNLKALAIDRDGKGFIRRVHKTFQGDYCIKIKGDYINCDKLKDYGWEITMMADPWFNNRRFALYVS